MPTGIYKRTAENITRYWQGKEFSDQHKKTLSEAKKGKPNLNRLGKKHSAKAKKKMSLAKQGYVPWNKGKSYKCKEGKRIIRICLMCQKEFKVISFYNYRIYCSVSCSGKALTGNKHATGYRHSEEVKKKIGEMHRGETHPLWIKDRTQLKKRERRNDSAYGEWRRQVRARDGWKCKIGNQDCKGRLEIHHILGWTPFPKLRYEVNNGISLCHFHHPRKREDEMKLSPYFQKLVADME